MTIKMKNDRVALLVIDMQNAYCHPEGSFSKLGRNIWPLRKVIPACRELIDMAHAAKIPVIYARYVLRADYKNGGILIKEIWPALAEVKYVMAGSWDAEIVDELKPNSEDFVIDKSRYSAFYATGLEPILTSLNIDTLVVCGVTTHYCVESTARDASQRDYKVFIVRDATAEINEAWHEMALTSFSRGWGWVVSRQEVISVFKEQSG